MVEKLAKMSFGSNVKTSVFKGGILKSGPGCNDVASRSEREIGQILVRRVSGADSHVRRFVYEHGMDRLDVLSTEAFEVWNEVGVGAVSLENVIELEILNLSDVLFSLQILIVLFMLLGK